MATTTLRLPEPLKLESETYAASIGISLNALMAVALRDYLDSPQRMQPSGKHSPSAPAVALSSSPAISDPPPVRVPSSEATRAALKVPKSPRAPCPCGSKAQWRHCHGKA